MDRALHAAALDLGHPWAEDANLPGSTGISPFAYTARDGVRVSTNDGYLEPARARENLTIVGEATVDRVLFDGRRARGVRVQVDGVWREARAREVLLSAGSVHSPTILLSSGIGPAAAVQALGLPLLREAPVGRNLRDHVAAFLELQLRPDARGKSRHTPHMSCVVRYSSGLAGTGLNDMFLFSVNVTGADEAGLGTGSLVVSAFQTFSVGELRLTSPDPHAYPEVNFNLLSDERDLVRMRDGVRHLGAIVAHPAVQAIAERAYTLVSGRDFLPLPEGAELDDWLMAECEDTRHTVGTCRMGPPGDPRSVVDPDCRVIGVDGLRVIDCSIMPEVPRANTHLSAVMVGEHMAARLRATRHTA